jgi:glucose-6-phosphate 1-epimerase
MNTILLQNEFSDVSQVELTSELTALQIKHLNCTAEVSLYGGQVLRFKPKDQQEVFWLSDKATYEEGSAIRGGIPLCWPWFGANDKSDVKSINHGFARQVIWQVDSVSADEKATTVVLTFEGDGFHSLWPTKFKLVQTLVFGQSMEQTFSMTNLSDTDTEYSGALHSYFSVSNPKNITLDSLTGVNFEDKLTDSSHTQEGSVSCVGPIDREYHSKKVMTVVDSQWSRVIKVTSLGCQQWVLWNPGTVLANTMTDIHERGEQEYICLEAANTQWQALPAGATIIMSQLIEVISKND